ncbi:MAG: hypothetical protein GXP46_10535 [Deferribacteres bacterium]|nr:hypothetical protein [Deferribacteres bacterium]
MSGSSKDTFTAGGEDNNGSKPAAVRTAGDSPADAAKKKEFKRELMNIFRKFGYLEEKKDYEIRIKTTSGNIAWINIRGIETIK